MKQALLGILASRKALIVLVISTTSFVAFFLGRATWDQAEGLVRWIVMTLIAGQSVEDAAKHLAGRPPSPTTTAQQVNVSSGTPSLPSNPPPA